MDCDDVTLLLAAGGAPTLSDARAAEYHRHVAECDACRELTREAGDARFRWVMRVPEDALDDPDLLVLPTVDPVMFISERELARGGMGRITRARDRRLGRDVAIKEVLNPALRARFEREVAITAQLQHPAIVPVYEAGTWPDGSAFYTMRLVPGGTLADAIGKARTLEQRLALLPHVHALTDALAYAHARGIVHRDLKPSNVLVGEFGETVVIDWGLAKELHRRAGDGDGAPRARLSPGLTMAGSVIGTPGFMAPEQAAGGDVDARADVYALGAILYSVLTGHPPYCDRDDVTPDALIALARERPPTPLARLAPRVPEDLRAIVERAMARDPAGRYPTAKDMADELRRFEAGQLLRSRDYRVRDLLARWIRRHRAAVTVGALALLAVAAVGIGAIVNVARSRAAERDARRAAELAQRSAEANVVTLLEEHGRDQLLAGDRTRAMVFLAEAYRRGDTSVALRHLLTEATRDLDLRDAAIDAGGDRVASVGFADDRVVTVGGGAAAAIAVWDRDRPVLHHPLARDLETAWLTPDARRAVILTRDGWIAVHDTITGARLWQLRAPYLSGGTAVFDRKGERVVLIAGESEHRPTAELRDTATGARIASLAPGAEAALVAAFSPDGRRVAAGDVTGAIGVWDIASGRRILTVPSSAPSQIAFLDSDRIVTCSYLHALRIWPLDGRKPQALSGDRVPVPALAVSPRGDRIATGNNAGIVRLWDREGKLLGEAHDHHGLLYGLAFSPDGAVLAGGGEDARVYLWDATALELLLAVVSDREHSAETLSRLAWSRDGSRLVTVRDHDRVAPTWRAPAGHRIARAAYDAAAAGEQLAVIADGTELSVRRLDTGSVVRQIPLTWPPEVPRPVRVEWIATDPGGTRAVLESLDARRILALDLTSGALLWSWPLIRPGGHWTSLEPSADARYAVEFLREIDDPTFTPRVLEIGTGRVVRELRGPRIEYAALSPGGDRCAMVFAGHTAPVVMRVATGERIALAPFDHPPQQMRFAPSGHRLIWFGPLVARVVDADTGRTLADLPGVTAEVLEARFDRDGHRVATWATDRSVTLWNADTGAALVSVNSVSLDAFAVSSDGLRLATGSDDGSIRIWDSATGRLLEVLHGDGPAAGDLFWSADGTRLVTEATRTGSVSIWDVHLEQRSPHEITELAPPSLASKLIDPLLAPGR